MVFSRIYQTNAWNGIESRSGPGSGSVATRSVVRELLELVAELDVQTVLDIACGDSFWMPELPGYTGIDIAPEAVRLARRQHPDRHYEVGDVRSIEARAVDLVIFRDAMQHMPLEAGVAALEAIRASGSSWLLASTYVGGENVDVADGDAFSPDLQEPPFSLGTPDRLIFDGYTYHDPDEIRDPRKHLGLWRLIPTT